MTTIETLFRENFAGLTVYTPDARQSQLWGNLDARIRSRTGLQPIYRRWFRHDYNSLMCFYAEDGDDPPQTDDPVSAARRYEDLPVSELQYGHLVVRMQLSGASLITIWQGEDAIDKLLSAKGKTQPAEANAESVRGSFWCDNAVCNLMHSSDDLSHALRELSAISAEDILAESPQALPTIPIVDPTPLTIKHSGLVCLANLIQRISWTVDTAFSFTLSPSDAAHEAEQHLSLQLRAFADSCPNAVLSQFIEQYLAGDLVAITEAFAQYPLSNWEQMVLQCGAINRDKWQSA